MLILGHFELDEKSNKIPATQAMIEALALEHRLFTMEAIHCAEPFSTAITNGQAIPAAFSQIGGTIGFAGKSFLKFR